MYILELVNKVFKSYKKKQAKKMGVEYTDEAEIPKCEHVFSPVDSTGETLACSRCGLVVKKGKNMNSMSID